MSTHTQVQEITRADEFPPGRIPPTRIEQRRDDRYPDGDNRSRLGFTFPLRHPKSQFFQNIIKQTIIKAINFAHKSIVTDYYSDAYKYDDVRLQALDSYFNGYINTNFQHAKPYKSDFMSKIIDIILFLMKEDIYYRARFFELINSLPKSELTQEEKDNIERFH